MTQQIASHPSCAIAVQAAPTKRSHPFTRVLVLCIALTGLADWFFYRRPAGWTTGIYLLVLLIVIALTQKRALRCSPGRVMGVALVGLALALMSQPGPLSLVFGLGGIISFAMIGRLPWRADATVWARRWLIFLVAGWVSLFQDRQMYKRWRRAGHGSSPFFQLHTQLKRWILPVLLTSIFIWLFAVANPIIGLALQKTTFVIQKFLSTLDVTVARVLFWMFCYLWLWALFRLIRQRAATAQAETPTASQIAAPSSVVRCLALFNVAFAFQSILDLLYLWGGAALPAGMTYAHYAHRGAYPLIATALLAAAFVLITFRDGPRTREMRVARQLVYLWLLQNVFLTFSALWRLRLYIEVYSLTRWRVAAAIWMILVAAGLLWIAGRILLGRTNHWLINVNFLTALVVLYGCCFFNFDRLISWYNVRHCREINHVAAPLDLPYLHRLGPESLPAIQWLLGHPLPGDVATNAQQYSAQLRAQLRTDLGDWRGWTFRRHQLKRYL